MVPCVDLHIREIIRNGKHYGLWGADICTNGVIATKPH